MTRKKKPNDNGSMLPLFGVPARGVIPPRVFRSMYPLSYALGLRPVSVAGAHHEGFDIDEVEKKLDAAMAHVSQWEPSIHHYRADWDPATLDKTKTHLRSRIQKKDGHYVEAFRNAAGFNQQ